MDILTFFIIIFIILFTVIFLPELFPRCENCSKTKFRFSFKLHKTVGIGYGYAACRSVCRKCCNKYSLHNINDYADLEHARKKAEIELMKKL